MNPDKARAIEKALRESGFPGMPIVQAESCLATDVTKRCRSVCKPVETFIKKATTDGLQKLHGERVLRQRGCKN